MSNLTREFLAEWTSQLQDRFISALPVEKVMPQYKASERLVGLAPSEVLSHYKASEVLSHYKASEVLSHYKPQERLAGLKPQEILSGLAPEDRQWLAKVLLEQKEQSDSATKA